MRKTYLAGALAGALGLALAAAALASPQFQQTADVKLTKARAGKSTGVRAALKASDPGEPGGKPKAATRVVVRFPRGTRVNSKAAPQCNLPEAEIIAGDCPRGSQVGRGTAKANGAPIIASTTEDIKVFNRRGGVAFLLTDNAADPQPAQTAVILAKLSRRGVLTANVPEFPLPVPGVFAVLTDFQVTISKKSKGRGERRINLITAPERCRRNFVTTTTFTYQDGSTERITTRQRCRR